MKHGQWFSIASNIQLLFLTTLCVYVLLHGRILLQNKHPLQRGEHSTSNEHVQSGFITNNPRGLERELSPCLQSKQDWNTSAIKDNDEVKYQLVAESYIIMQNSTALDSYDIRKTQQKRQSLLRSMCHQRNISDENVKQYANIFVVDEYKFMYCAVRKVASITWNHVIHDLKGVSDKGAKVQKRVLSSYTGEEIAERLKSYKKFMFVREPLQRVFSAWYDKFRNAHAVMKSEFERMLAPYVIGKIRPLNFSTDIDSVLLPGRFSLNLTFIEFVRYLTEVVLDIEQEDMHWNPYYHRCNPCHVQYDFIGHYETLKADSDELLRELCIDHLVTFPSRQSTSSQLAPKYYSGIDNETMHRLGELYRRDYEMFGYSIKRSIDLLKDQDHKG